ncbi:MULTISPECIES: GNAT family N-acetyltransferase [Mammaliicoccus]|uniref:GNAT family N-acetyltransferase n=1 Tax=Mammaliicoccus fleurettii TaxID=150056 RepID=A0ABS5MR64_9STAP|nr:MULTISPECIES: GNAT family N-acetyltransferase [Mammaliicoccus]MBL0846826.1 GNAT family N-acetyltransferase [Mammaliicoccus fleurettii]MBS3670788.1 GNAT family N-acetyltransferase [Mammaliicoccus fleurettii]MBS3698156.1 GNAT family N-acetyltransferase [Mammaliicoccus fleurettii]MBW0764597.1 GNAT family N-acetyltransferase [Mammaliicoccus fleurettii]MEB7805587.1 GNAT family N-acetyltransferase [Mammaliicoccus fleurettii]
MEFREINTDIESMFTEYISEWYENEESVVPWSTDVKHHGGFKKMLMMQKEAINPINKDFVKAKTFVLIDNQHIVGAVNIRYALNEFLENKGGHVGYGVRKSERGKGYATKLLEYALIELREESVEKALITCDENNLASQKVIIHNNGVEAEPFISDDNEITKRFWINLE